MAQQSFEAKTHMASITDGTEERPDSEYPALLEVKVHDADKRPSWKLTGTGHADFSLRAHYGAQWIELNIMEGYTRDGKFISKAASITLTRTTAKQLMAELSKIDWDSEVQL
jgi:hypothetical protein